MRQGGRRGAFILISLLAFGGTVLPAVTQAGAATGRPLPTDQGKARAQEKTLQHEVSVTLKLIQVFVTGPDGQPALELDKGDFAVTDNGRPQTITAFEKHIFTLPAADRRPAVLAQPSAGATAPPLLGRKFILLIDYVRNGLEGVHKAKAVALEFLDSKIGPDDEVGLFTLSPVTGLTLHEYLTTDHAKVRAKLRKLRDSVGGGSDFSGGEIMGMELLNAQVFAGHGGHAGPTSRNLFEEIASWARVLRAIPGQKNIILFTMGFGNAVVRPGRLNNVLFETMARELATANAPVFTVDTSPQVPPGPGEDKLRSGTLAERSLDYLSRTTGGRYLGAVNHRAQITTGIQDATANYYVLGYGVPAAWDGKYHEVKVEVGKPGYVVHAQRGYFNPVPFAKLTPIEKHLHLLEAALGGSPSARQAPAFPLAAYVFPESNGVNTLLLAEISQQVREGLGGRTELISLVLDEKDAIVDGRRAEIDWTGLGSGTYFGYELAGLAPGRYEARVVIRNIEDGRTAVGACSIDVAAPPAEGPAVSPPFFLVPGAGGQYLNLAPKTTAGGEEGPGLSGIFPFPAEAYLPLVGPLAAGATRVCVELVYVWKGERSGEKDLTARLRSEGGGEDLPIATELIAAASRDDRDFYLLSFEFPGLAPGRYRLEIRAEDAATGSVVLTAGVFTVR